MANNYKNIKGIGPASAEKLADASVNTIDGLRTKKHGEYSYQIN